jgi:SAM-dependent methyltransferase
MSMPATTAGLMPDPVRFAPKRSRFMQNAIDPGVRHLRQTIRARLMSALGVGTGESVIDLPTTGLRELSIHSFDVVLADFDVMHHTGPYELATELFRICRFGGRIGLACPTPESFPARVRQTIDAYLSPSNVAPYAQLEGTRESLNEWFGAGAMALGAANRSVTLDYSSTEHWLADWLSSYQPLKHAFVLLESGQRVRLRDDLVRLAKSSSAPVRGFLRIRCDYLECLVHKGMPQ